MNNKTESMDYWFDGLPMQALRNPYAKILGMNYWFDGLPAPFMFTLLANGSWGQIF